MITHQNDNISPEDRAIKEQEIEYYQRIIRKFSPFTPFSINAHIKLGKLYAELGNINAAIREYAFAADQYVRNGAVVKAIAVNKMIAMLDPQQQQTLSQPGHLYFQQSDSAERAPSSMSGQHPDEQENFDFPEYEHSANDETFFLFEENIPKTELAQKLTVIPLFSYLTDAERQKIAEFLSPVEMKQGATIIAEGETGDCMYLIQSGEVAIYTTLTTSEIQRNEAHQEEQIQLASLKEGDFFGEQALITNEPRNATVVARTDLQLLRFSKPDLNVILKQYPRISKVLFHHHQQRITNALECLHAAFQHNEL